jgi:large subunit ribosomal protein L6
MSRVGKKPIQIPKGVTVTISGEVLKAKGPKGQLDFPLHKAVSVKQVEETLQVSLVEDKGDQRKRHKEAKMARALWGMTRSRVQAVLVGISEGFTRELELQGIGYRAALKGQSIELAAGFSHPVVIPLPTGVQAKIEKEVRIILSGANKEDLGEIAARIRSVRPPDVYKGKGVRYKGEVVRKKAGKSAAAKSGG